MRPLGHRMVDDVVDALAMVRDRPVWQPAPDQVRAHLENGVTRQDRNLSRAGSDAMWPTVAGHWLNSLRKECTACVL